MIEMSDMTTDAPYAGIPKIAENPRVKYLGVLVKTNKIEKPVDPKKEK